MGWYKIKIRPVDRWASKYTRLRDKGLCQYNFKCYKGTEGSQTSHFQKRRKESVRCDPRNLDWVCAACHNFVENHKDGQKTLEEFKKNQLGEMEYKRFMILANDDSRKHKDDKMNILILKQLIKNLDD